jgi:hypothetical protein
MVMPAHEMTVVAVPTKKTLPWEEAEEAEGGARVRVEEGVKEEAGAGAGDGDGEGVSFGG